MLGTDESMVLEEIEKMENEGIICGYPTLINWDKTDTEKVTAFIEVRVTPQRGQGFEKLAERITNYPEVKSIYLMSGAFDFAIFLRRKNIKRSIHVCINEAFNIRGSCRYSNTFCSEKV